MFISEQRAQDGSGSTLFATLFAIDASLTFQQTRKADDLCCEVTKYVNHYSLGANLGYCAPPPPGNFNGCQIIYKDILNVKHGRPQKLTCLGCVKMHGVHGNP